MCNKFILPIFLFLLFGWTAAIQAVDSAESCFTQELPSIHEVSSFEFVGGFSKWGGGYKIWLDENTSVWSISQTLFEDEFYFQADGLPQFVRIQPIDAFTFKMFIAEEIEDGLIREIEIIFEEDPDSDFPHFIAKELEVRYLYICKE